MLKNAPWMSSEAAGFKGLRQKARLPAGFISQTRFAAPEEGMPNATVSLPLPLNRPVSMTPAGGTQCASFLPHHPPSRQIIQPQLALWTCQITPSHHTVSQSFFSSLQGHVLREMSSHSFDIS